MPLPLHVAFVAGSSGMWRIERITAVNGDTLPPAQWLAVLEGLKAFSVPAAAASWALHGTTSNARYTAIRFYNMVRVCPRICCCL
jgi:hypothetical protein